MKIMTAMYTLKKGGFYERFKMMIETFLERDCEVHCLSLVPIQIEHSHFYNHVLFFPLKTTDGFTAKWAVFIIFPLWSIWIAWCKKIDIIIAFGSLYAFLQGFSKRSLKRPMVTFLRGNPFLRLTMQHSAKYFLHLNKMVEHCGLLFSDRIITNNHPMQMEIMRSLRRKKNVDVQVLFNNIPLRDVPSAEDIYQTRLKYGIPKDGKILITAGVLNFGKNIEMLIKCLPKIGMPSLFLFIIGDGFTKTDLRYKNYLRELTTTLGLNDKVTFTGWLEKEDLWKTYPAGDLFVLPSKSEGMPNAMLEALGFDLPCIGSDIPGIRDILQYEDLMFAPLDEKGLIFKVQQVFSNRQFFDRVRRLCKERKEVFSFDWSQRLYQMVTTGLRRQLYPIRNRTD